jgi:hypothetical protein
MENWAGDSQHGTGVEKRSHKGPPTQVKAFMCFKVHTLIAVCCISFFNTVSIFFSAG